MSWSPTLLPNPLDITAQSLRAFRLEPPLSYSGSAPFNASQILVHIRITWRACENIICWVPLPEFLFLWFWGEA